MALIPVLIDFTPGTTIVSSQVDSNFAAVRTAFNDTAVLTDVVKTIAVSHLYSAPQLFAGGTAANPGVSFSADPDCGLYRIGSDNLGLAVAGVKRWDFGTAGSTLTGDLTVSGTATFAAVAVSGSLTVGALTVTGTGTFGALAVSGAALFTDTLRVNGGLTIGGSPGTIKGVISNDSVIDILSGSTNAASVGAWMRLGSNLSTTLGALLLIAGDAAQGDIIFHTGASVERGRFTRAGVFAVTGATTLASTLAVTGAVTMSSTLAVTGPVTVTGAVTSGSIVSGAAVLTGNLVYGVSDGADWDLRPPVQFGLGLRLRPNQSSGGAANRRFEIGSWDNSGIYTGLVRVDELGTLSMLVGGLTTKASAAGATGLNIPHGAAPSAPVNGDMWTTTAGLFVRINGVTKTVTLT